MIDCRYMQWLRAAVAEGSAASFRCGCRGGFGVALMSMLLAVCGVGY